MQISGISGNAEDLTATVTSSPRLVRAAREFEGQMMKELLKPMTQASGLTGEEADESEGSGGVLGEFACEALGQALSQRGGFGIADRIIEQLSHSGSSCDGGKVLPKCKSITG
jgi:Rod binding domain-containing protein